MNNHTELKEVSIVVVLQGDGIKPVLVVFDAQDVAEEYLYEICKRNPFCKAYTEKCIVATRADFEEWKKI